MGCVYTHRKIPTIEGWGSPSHIRSIVEKIGENYWKPRKTSRAISQTHTLGSKHDKIQEQWVSNISSENILERVSLCRHFEMESWSWTICCPMSCSNEEKDA
jgi:hypothetical protein